MRFIGLVVAMTCLVPTAAFAVRPGGIRVPIKFQDSRIYVPVRISGEATSWFILDTGSTGTILDQRIADRLHLRSVRTDIVYGAGAGSSEHSQIGGLRLRVGNVPLRVSNAAAADLGALLGPTSGRIPGGIIGSRFFREHVIEIDFQHGELRVWPRGTDLRDHYARSVPLTFADWTPLADAKLSVRPGVALDERVLVDLGAKSTLLIPEPYIVRRRLNDVFAHTVTLPLGAGVGGNTYYSFARARRIALSGDALLSLANPIVGLSANGTLRSTWNEGLLGADYFSRFAIAFDYGRSRLLLTRLSDNPEPLDRSGMFVVWRDAPTTYTVRDVLAGGPADRAGVRPGDVVLEIGGQRAQTLSIGDIRTVLKSRAPSISLVVLRSGQTLKLSLGLRDLI